MFGIPLGVVIDKWLLSFFLLFVYTTHACGSSILPLSFSPTSLYRSLIPVESLHNHVEIQL